MNRKHFIASLAPLGLALTANAKVLQSQNNVEDTQYKAPRYLRKGDSIGITCPAGYLTPEELEPAQKKMEEWGFGIKLGTTAITKSGTFSGTDEERKKDMQAMLDDPSIQAIMCGRGGYGCNRIIDELDFTKFKKNPKWIIGFSDITLLHTHINSRFNIATIHSKMCNSFLSDWSKGEPQQIESIESIRDVLFGRKLTYTAQPNTFNREGKATGILVGGNLSIIYSAMNTTSQLNTKNCILFLEEVDEKLYSIDRMMWNLKRTGTLKHLKGLIIGGFRTKPSDKPENEFAETVQDIILNVTKEYKYPVCFDFPVGHQKVNYALQCGIMHSLQVTQDSVLLKKM